MSNVNERAEILRDLAAARLVLNELFDRVHEIKARLNASRTGEAPLPRADVEALREELSDLSERISILKADKETAAAKLDELKDAAREKVTEEIRADVGTIKEGLIAAEGVRSKAIEEGATERRRLKEDGRLERRRLANEEHEKYSVQFMRSAKALLVCEAYSAIESHAQRTINSLLRGDVMAPASDEGGAS